MKFLRANFQNHLSFKKINDGEIIEICRIFLGIPDDAYSMISYELGTNLIGCFG